MAALAAGAQLVDDLRVDPRLCVHETLQIEGVACGLHMSYGGTVVKRRTPQVPKLTSGFSPLGSAGQSCVAFCIHLGSDHASQTKNAQARASFRNNRLSY